MGKKSLMIKVSYSSDDDGTSTKKEVKEEEKQLISYLRGLIELDFHDPYKLKISKGKI